MSSDFEKNLDKYAEVIVKVGLNIQPGQRLLIGMPFYVFLGTPIELAPLVTSRPGEALSLCDALWEEPYLEFRLLAASILGLIPADPPDPIFIRVENGDAL